MIRRFVQLIKEIFLSNLLTGQQVFFFILKLSLFLVISFFSAFLISFPLFFTGIYYTKIFKVISSIILINLCGIFFFKRLINLWQEKWRSLEYYSYFKRYVISFVLSAPKFWPKWFKYVIYSSFSFLLITTIIIVVIYSISIVFTKVFLDTFLWINTFQKIIESFFKIIFLIFKDYYLIVSIIICEFFIFVSIYNAKLNLFKSKFLVLLYFVLANVQLVVIFCIILIIAIIKLLKI